MCLGQGPFSAAGDGQAGVEDRTGLGQSAGLQVDGSQADVGGHEPGIAPSVQRFEHREVFGCHPEPAFEVAAYEVQGGEIVQRLGDGWVAVPSNATAQQKGVLQRDLGSVEVIQVAVGRADDVQDLCEHLRLVLEVVPQRRIGVAEDVVDGERIALGYEGIRSGEDPLEYVGDGAGFGGFLRSPIALEGVEERGDCQHQEDEAAHGGADAMATQENGRSIRQGIRAREDSLSVEVALDVFAELGGGGIPAGRVLVQGLEDHRIEIAGECAPEAIRRRGAGAAHVLGRQVIARAVRAGSGDGPAHDLGGAGRFGARGGWRSCPFQCGVTRDQFVEERTQLEDVARRGDLASVELFGAGVGRCEETLSQGRVNSGQPQLVRAEHFGDAEIEQFDEGLPIGTLRDENVRGFQVAVDDQVLVGVLHRVADVLEQAEAFFDGEAFCVAECVDRLAVDVFHHEKRQAVRRDAAVEEAGDVGMVECGEQAAFLEEAVADILRVEPAADDLQGDAQFQIVGAAREPDRAHAPATEPFFDFVDADSVAVLGAVFFVLFEQRLAEFGG